VEPLMRLMPMEPSRRVRLVRKNNKQRKDLHHEDNEGGWTMREYTELSGTEKAYDSGLGVGKSINTPSTIGHLQEHRQ
jgi:hypothetical protein